MVFHNFSMSKVPDMAPAASSSFRLQTIATQICLSKSSKSCFVMVLHRFNDFSWFSDVCWCPEAWDLSPAVSVFQRAIPKVAHAQKMWICFRQTFCAAFSCFPFGAGRAPRHTSSTPPPSPCDASQIQQKNGFQAALKQLMRALGVWLQVLQDLSFLIVFLLGKSWEVPSLELR